MSRASGMQCDLHPGSLGCIQLSEVSRRGFTNQNLVRAVWSLQMPQLKCWDFVHVLGCLFLFATGSLAKYHGTHVWHSSHWWYSWDPLEASLQPKPFLCPPSLCPGSGWAPVSSTTVLQHPAVFYGHGYPTSKIYHEQSDQNAENYAAQVGSHERGTVWAGTQTAFLV